MRLAKRYQLYKLTLYFIKIIITYFNSNITSNITLQINMPLAYCNHKDFYI